MLKTRYEHLERQDLLAYMQIMDKSKDAVDAYSKFTACTLFSLPLGAQSLLRLSNMSIHLFEHIIPCT